MLECRSCVLRSIEAIAGRAIPASQIGRSPLVLTPHLVPFANRRDLSRSSRSQATAESKPRSQGDNEKALVKTKDGGKALAKTKDHQTESTTQRKGPSKAVQIELSWIHDKVKLANHVHYTLSSGNVEKALELCRSASKKMDCVVAWNHTINWHVQNGRHNEAMKLFNEMKKRAQFPDSYTYMTLLRGFPQFRTHLDDDGKKQMALKAVALYNSMLSPSGKKVPPTIMHTNTVLRVCALADDMDSLWSVAAKLSDMGANSPDHITYTTILDAVRHHALIDAKALSEQAHAVKIHKSVDEGRRLWRDVISRWRKGALQIDAALVSAMARLLLISRSIRDWDDVLNLVQQTTGHPRLLPTLDSRDRHTQHVPLPKPLGDAEVERDTIGFIADEKQRSDVKSTEDGDGFTETTTVKIFDSVAPAQQDSKMSNLAWVPLSNEILNAVIQACTQMRASAEAHKYWDFFAENGVKPDLANYHALLRLLRLNRSSATAAKMLQQLVDNGIQPRYMTFRQAMAVCARNTRSPLVVDNATSIVEIMRTAVLNPDLHTLGQYLDLATSTKNVDKIVLALENVKPFLEYIRAQSTGQRTFRKPSDSGIPRAVEQEDVLSLLKMMVGAIDTVTKSDGVSDEKKQEWQPIRFEMDGYIGQIVNSKDQRESKRARRSNDSLLRDHARRKAELKACNEELVRLGLAPAPVRMSKQEWAGKTEKWRSKRGQDKEAWSQSTDRKPWTRSVRPYRPWEKGSARTKNADAKTTPQFTDSW